MNDYFKSCLPVIPIPAIENICGYECIKNLQKSGFKIYATVPDKNANPIGKINFKGKCGIVFGNEGNGMSKESIDVCDDKITIPMNKNSESLNVSVAAGISIWEMCNRGKEL